MEGRQRTVTEITAELFRSPLTGAQRHFAMAEILAYLAYHEIRNVLERGRLPDGVFLWRAATNDDQGANHDDNDDQNTEREVTR